MLYRKKKRTLFLKNSHKNVRQKITEVIPLYISFCHGIKKGTLIYDHLAKIEIIT